MKHLACSLVMLLCATVTFAADDPADALAKTILQQAGIRVGVCELPRVGDGTLAAALARTGIAQVHGLAPDAAAVEAARRPAAAWRRTRFAGRDRDREPCRHSTRAIGWRIWWWLQMPRTTNLKDCAAGRSAAGACRRTAAWRWWEILAAATSGLNPTFLGELGEGNRRNGRDHARTPAVCGPWSRCRRSRAATIGRISIMARTATRYRTIPRFAEGHLPCNATTSHARLINGERSSPLPAACSVCREVSITAEPYSNELVVRNMYNGQILWRRPLEYPFGRNDSLIIATAERVYLKYKNNVLVLNPETGEEIDAHRGDG